jgi:hypothetical protein
MACAMQVGASARLRGPEDATDAAMADCDEDADSAEAGDMARDQDGAGIAPQVYISCQMIYGDL